MWVRGYRGDERGVSDLIGTILLLGVTVAIFSIFSFAVLDQLDTSEPPRNIEFRVDITDDRTTIIAVWGESLPLPDAKLMFDLDGIRTTKDLAAEPLMANFIQRPLGSSLNWDVGEAVRLSCPLTEACAYPGQEVSKISVLQGTNYVLFSSEPGVSRGALVNPVADLEVSVVSIRDPNPLRAGDPDGRLYEGGTSQITARVANVGIVGTPNGVTLTLKIFVDGALVASQPHGAFLAPGESFTAQTVPALLAGGSHNLRIEVERSQNFLEASLDNNILLRTFSVVPGLYDPGHPYEDGNNDILYNPYLGGDIEKSRPDVVAGYTALPGNGLVIPPLTGAITRSATLTFSAPGGSLTIGVNLRTTTTNDDINLDAGGRVRIDSGVEIRAFDDATITGGTGVTISGATVYAGGNGGGGETNIDAIAGSVNAVGTSFVIGGLVIPNGLDIVASAGEVDLTDAAVETDLTVDVEAKDVIRLDRADVVSDDIDLRFSDGAPNTVFVNELVVDDTGGADAAANCVNTTPFPVTVSGAETAGRVEEAGNACP